MHGKACSECGYSSQDGNGTNFHNGCLQKVQRRTIRVVFVLGFVVGALFCFLGGKYAYSG